MDRLAAVVAAAAFASALLADVASAQELARLHVRAFTLGADRTSVRVGEAFHLTIAARVDEGVADLDNVTLPNLSGFEELGDERRCASDASGSSCVETLTLDATEPGDQTIGSAALAAIDARTGRPSRFLTSTLAIHVEPAGPLGSDVRDSLYGLAEGVLRFALIALFLLVASAALWWSFLRRNVRSPGPAPALQPAVAEDEAARNGSLGLGPAVDELTREPTRARVLAVRQVLRRLVNARDDETLDDLARRLPHGPPLPALAAVERASFCEETRLSEAIAEALPYLR